MPTLLELQHAVERSLLAHADGEAAGHILAGDFTPAERLSIHRNTHRGTLIAALRPAFPAFHRLVGGDFFDRAAGTFIDEQPPRSAYLNDYGAELPELLSRLPAAASLSYLSDVARLEWAVNRALHAPDTGAFDLARLTALDRADHDRVRFVPGPSLSLVSAACPADALWRAVLARDGPAIAAFDPSAGPVWLLVERRTGGVEVVVLDESAWRFTAALCAGSPLQDAIEAAPAIDAAALLAEHLAIGRFVDFDTAEAVTRAGENSS